MKIAEVFYSIQGEGSFVGCPSVFIRTSGCNLRCSWCDTRYASWEPEGEKKSLEEILTLVNQWPQANHVVITGGEPYLFPELNSLVESLKRLKKIVTIETSGTIYQATSADLVSIAPKLKSSTPDALEFPAWAEKHERLRLNEEALVQFVRRSKKVQFKFVLQDPENWKEAEDLLNKIHFSDREAIFVMPECRSREELEEKTPVLTQWCLEQGLRFADRMHVRFWGSRKGV